MSHCLKGKINWVNFFFTVNFSEGQLIYGNGSLFAWLTMTTNDNCSLSLGTLCMIFTILLTFLQIHNFCNFVPNRHPELALKTSILVPKVAYDLPEFKIRPKDQIGTIHTWSINHMCITIFAQKMSVESWKSYIVL